MESAIVEKSFPFSDVNVHTIRLQIIQVDLTLNQLRFSSVIVGYGISWGKYSKKLISKEIMMFVNILNL